MSLESLRKGRNKIIERVSEMDKELTTMAVDSVIKYFEDHYDIESDNEVYAEMIADKDYRPYVKSRIALVLDAMHREGLLEFEFRAGIPHYKLIKSKE